MSVHPAILLGIWMTFTGVLPWLAPGRLAACSVLLLGALLHAETRSGFLLLLRRTRVLLFVLVLLYGFATPGVALFPEWPVGPSIEGLRQGGLQAWRLLLVLASLALLLAHAGRTGLTAGIYVLAAPLKAFGVPVDRFAVRLALALNMAGRLPPLRLSRDGVSVALTSTCPASPSSVEFDLAPVTGRDVLFVLGTLLLFGWLLW